MKLDRLKARLDCQPSGKKALCHKALKVDRKHNTSGEEEAFSRVHAPSTVNLRPDAGADARTQCQPPTVNLLPLGVTVQDVMDVWPGAQIIMCRRCGGENWHLPADGDREVCVRCGDPSRDVGEVWHVPPIEREPGEGG
jgi:hypothetical protein